MRLHYPSYLERIQDQLTRKPKFKIGETIQIPDSPYSFRVDEILYEGPGMWRYRGQMYKNKVSYRYGTITERAAEGY